MKPVKQAKNPPRSDRFLGHGSETTFITPGDEGSWLDVVLMGEKEDAFATALQKVRPFVVAKTVRVKDAAKLNTNQLATRLQVADHKTIRLLAKALRGLDVRLKMRGST